MFHLLPDIQHPVLILTGVFDPVIPAYQGLPTADRRRALCAARIEPCRTAVAPCARGGGTPGFEMAELLPNCRHVWLATSAHVAFLDAPGAACRELERFMQAKTPSVRFRRKSSSFE